MDEAYIIQNIIDTIGADKVAHVFALGTNQSLGAIDDIGRALSIRWVKQNGKSTKELKLKKRALQHTIMDKDEKKKQLDAITAEIKKIDDYNAKLNNPWSLTVVARIKKEWQIDKDQCEKKYPELFYYYKGMKDVTISASMHPAGIVVSPITLADNYGIMYNEGKAVLQLDMDAAHDVNLVKYDILKLKSVKVLNQACKYLEVPYPKCYEVDWDDQAVWADIAEDNLTIPQYESNFAAQLIKTMKPTNITELAIINAAIRPAGTSYRDKLTQRISNKTSNPDVDEFLKETYSYCVFQEQIMGFLQKFCGYSGSEADTIRRVISDKNHAKLDAMTPDILNRYIERRVAQGISRTQSTEEANEYFKVIHDAGSYAFNKSHAVAYSLLGYMFGYMRYYHFPEYICAFLNYADNESDIINGTRLATSRGYKIEEPKFRYGSSLYSYDKENKLIYKGMGSIKYLNDTVADQLYALRNNQYNNFFDLLVDLVQKTSINSRQLQILIKLDFFAEFGNSRLLLEYVDWFNKLRSKGSKDLFLKSVAKEGVFPDIIYKIVANHSKETNTRYMLTDVPSILSEISELLQSVGYKDIPMREKIITQREYLGYISLKTGKEEDRTTCIITAMQPLMARKGKSAGKVWARVFKTHSIGSGKNSELWIKESDYQKQDHFTVDDIITINFKKMKREQYQGRTQWWVTEYMTYIDN